MAIVPFHTIEIDLSADSKKSIVKLDGVELRFVTDLLISATVGKGAKVTIEMFADVKGIARNVDAIVEDK